MLEPCGKTVNRQNRVASTIRRYIAADLALYFQPINVKSAAFHVEDVPAEEFVVRPFHLNDPASLVNTAFYAIAYQTIVIHPVGSFDKTRTLKVHAAQDRYRWEVWDSSNPDYKNEHLTAIRFIEDIEKAFRASMHCWRTKCANSMNA